ncbi:MAG TPA: hypothetical protein VGO40_05570 [Longimicrobium sp.]|jgi:hypothetical protein|nr:hypothetical protein [Longimicrobium sp.]
MKHLTRDMLVDVFEMLPDTFDAHDLERRTLRVLPVPFAEELLEFRSSDDPLLQFSAAFAQWFDRAFAGEVTKLEKVETENLGGLVSTNQQWAKRKPTPAT